MQSENYKSSLSEMLKIYCLCIAEIYIKWAFCSSSYSGTYICNPFRELGTKGHFGNICSLFNARHGTGHWDP